MTQPFTEALTWVPRSRALGMTLGRAHDLTRAQGHAAVTLEHLLLALIEDPDASGVLLACNVDLLALNSAVSAEILRLPGGAGASPAAAPTLVTVLEYAVAAARQSKRADINGAIVLAAIVGEGKSDAARLLQAGGLKFQDAVQALRRTATQQRSASAGEAAETPPAPPLAASEPQTKAHPVAGAAPAANGSYSFDDDPVTTARRRVEAMRNGQSPGPLPPPAAAPAPASSAAASSPAPVPLPSPPPLPVAANGAQPRASNAGAGDWAPPPAPPASATPRPPRMPPPVPPIAQLPPRPVVLSQLATATRAPWADAVADAAPSELPPAATSFPGGPTIEPARLIERIPDRLVAQVPTTIEIRIARSAVLSTAAAAGVAGNLVLTRALAVRLKAPLGGYHIEPAAPETQWFDVRDNRRDDDEVRWRWIVTPHGPGSYPLQLSIAMRTLASDGIMIETLLPEHQTSVGVGRNLGADARTAGAYVAAGFAGAFLALIASGDWIAILGRLLR